MRIPIFTSALTLAAAITMQAQNVPLPPEQKTPPMLMLEGRAVKGLPYSAELMSESVQTLTDGNRIVHRTVGRISRDAEGRTRREESRDGGAVTVSITDPVANTSFTLDAVARTARETPNLGLFRFRAMLDDFAAIVEPGWTKRESVVSLDGIPLQPAPGGRGGRGRGGNRDNVAEEKLPNQMMEGVLASGVRRTTTIEAGKIGNERAITIVSEEWTSPELQILVMTDFTDPRTGRSTYRLLKINRTEPDPALFQVPADYTVQRLGRGGAAPAGSPGRGRGGS